MLESEFLFSRACDFFLLANEPKQAEEALRVGLRRFTSEGKQDQLSELPAILERLERYFGEESVD
ncbi:MAG: hypothetical protein DRI90_22770 [Deltaproteobacteria bacterium]|nr:MAG: hypothetical protein DRI90_22770 [Deltaproteobacteria bacterium]